MLDRTEYRIKINGEIKTHPTYSSASEAWQRIAETSETRGGINATLESRFVCTDNDGAFYDCLSDKNGIIRLKDIVILPWECIAEVHS